MEAKLVSKTQNNLNEDGYHISYNIKDKTTANFFHYHDYYEIMIYLGNIPMQFTINEKEFWVNRGDIALVNIFEPHEFKGDLTAQTERLCLGLSPGILLNSLTVGENLTNLFSCENEKYPLFKTDIWNMRRYMNIINDLMNKKLDYGEKIRKRALVLHLLAYICNDCHMSKDDLTINSKRIEVVSSIIKYVDTHLADKISLEKLAEEVNYSESYIGKIFKDVTKQPLTGYIVNKRLINAASYLREGYPIAEVSEMVGFNNYSYFFKAFKKQFGVSPMEYKNDSQIVP